MKNIFLSIFFISALTLTSCGNYEKEKKQEDADAAAAKAEEAAVADAANAPELSLVETNFDFGTIAEGKKVEHVFTFTNTGKSDLIITSAQASCGCTASDYPKNTPIAPGQKGQIKVSFDSNGKPGKQQKTVTVMSNTLAGRELIRISADVTADPVKQQQRDEALKQRQQQAQQ